MAAYCVANFDKHKRADVRGLQAEANREMEKGKYKNDVDPSRTAQNFYFVRSDDWQKSITEAIEEAGVKESKTSVVLTTSVYSASPEWFEAHKDDRAAVMAYFESCLEFERSRGKVINAVIHFDETTPHMQTATVPIVDVPVMECKQKTELDENGEEVIARYKKGKSKGTPIYERTPKTDENGQVIMQKGLSAKTVFGGKVKMSREQTRFWEQCGKPFGMERGECRVKTPEAAKERLDEAEYKAQQIIKGAEKEAARTRQEAREKAQTEADGIKSKAEREAAQTRQKAEIDAAQTRQRADNYEARVQTWAEDEKKKLDARADELQQSEEEAAVLRYLKGFTPKGSKESGYDYFLRMASKGVSPAPKVAPPPKDDPVAAVLATNERIAERQRWQRQQNGHKVLGA